MKRQTTVHKLIYYIKNKTSEKYTEWRSITIDFFYQLFDLSERNPGINIIMLKTVGLNIHYKDKAVCYMNFNKKSFTVYLFPDNLLNKVSDKIFNTPFDSGWHRAYKVNTKEEVEALVDYLTKLKVVNLSSSSKRSRRIPTWVKEFVRERDERKCKVCGATEDLCFDHILPYSKGGLSDHPTNIQLLCKKCNLKKLDKLGLD
ncbi:HNH endonuclease [bacterium]|nr:HNH endonuclease [bacterium]